MEQTDMKSRPIYVDNTMQELTNHGTPDFPVSMDRQKLSEAGCHDVKHWHSEIQINVVTEGAAVFETPAGRYLLKAGEGLFINSGVLHEAFQAPGFPADTSTYICVNFLPSLIYGSKDTLIYRDYIKPFESTPALQSFALRDQPWHQEIIRKLLALADINDRQEYGYEIEMKIRLLEIWHLIIKNNKAEAERISAVSFADRKRLRLLLDFIHKNYMNSITLADIAAAGSISRGECCHVFRRTGNPSPITYLNHYRILQSMKLLVCTNLSITEIAYQVGFESGSYYTERFKREQHCTPLEYRIKQCQTFIDPDREIPESGQWSATPRDNTGDRTGRTGSMKGRSSGPGTGKGTGARNRAAAYRA